MFKLLVDTCVWLDLAKDQRQTPLLGVIEEMTKLGILSLIVPRLVLDEFKRNRETTGRWDKVYFERIGGTEGYCRWPRSTVTQGSCGSCSTGAPT